MGSALLTIPGVNNPTRRDYPIFRRSVTIDPPDSAEGFLFNCYVSPATQKIMSVTMPAIGAQATIINFTVPQNRNGRIWRIANGTAVGGGIATWVNGSGSLIWQILRNGSPFKNMNNIASLVGLVEMGGAQLSAGLPLRPNDNIALVVKNMSLPAAGQILIGLLGGYYYPSNLNPSNLRG